MQYWKDLIDFAQANNKAIVAIATVFLSAFTVILALATIFLWSATRNLVRGAEKTAERQLRAYVALEGGSIAHATVENGAGFHVTVRLKNFGLTPAYSFTTWIMPPEILAPDALPFTSSRPISERTGTSIIGPGSDAWINWYAGFGDKDLDDIRSGIRSIFIWGGADYTDAFGKRRYFIFRDRISGRENGPNCWALSPHPLGYDAN
jgi:hypothetical protein